MYTPWGKSVAIDLYGCDHQKITSSEVITDFIHAVVKEIDMVLHGPLHIERFGDESKHPGPGYSAMQFIETSSITIHMDEYQNRAFVDIFSCKDFDAEKAAAFTKDYFNGQSMKFTALDR